MVASKGDKIVFYIICICTVIAIFLMTISIIGNFRILYFFGEFLFFTFLPAAIIYSFLLSILNGNITGKLVYLVRIIALFIYVCFIFADKSYFSSRLLDIPNIVNGNYANISGKPYDISIEGIKTRTQYFTINKKRFSVETCMIGTNLYGNKNYRITYLENSNYVIDITAE